ncbi:MAG TPA: hypothetical protein VFL79_18425 [Terriglobia bacterium]|nr:hypothetical protein [Terriglobia bacterium]
MRTPLVAIAFLFLGLMLATPAGAQGVFKVETGEAFNKIVPRDFVLEENSIPTEKRNSALVLTPSGGRLVAGLLDTSGYSSQVQEKYLGMLISEGTVDVCGHQVATGSYGFGLAKTKGVAGGHPSRLFLYNQAGKMVAECATSWNENLKNPRPLQVVVGGGGTARLYLGRTWVGLK